MHCKIVLPRPRKRPGRALLLLAASVLAPAAAPVVRAAESSWLLDMRYRFEHVEDDAFNRDADANTLRIRLGHLLSLTPAWSFFAEGEYVENINDDFNSTANGRTAFPVVADPEHGELNQAWAAYHDDIFDAKLGRQRILIDNLRFVANVGWRQNEQTYDAFRLAVKPLPGLTLDYSYLDRAHRVFSDAAIDPLLRERNHDSHLLDIAWSPRPGWSLGGYGYFLKDQDKPSDSSATLGVRWTGKQALGADRSLSWRLEYARQYDYRNQPQDYSLDYWRIEPRVQALGVDWYAGWERLDGNGRIGLSTPLALLHAFNGWADRFLTTPADGLDDRFAGIGARLGKFDGAVVWHDFTASHGDGDYGREWNASLSRPLGSDLTAMVKLADYRSDGFGADVRKVWFQLEWKKQF